MSRRRAEVHCCFRDVYIMSEPDVERSIIESTTTSLFIVRTAGTNAGITVVCDPNFMHELLAYFSWGERHGNNYFEDAFRICGQVLYGNENDESSVTLVPRFLLRTTPSSRTKTSVAVSAEGKQSAAYQSYIISESLSQTDYSFLQAFGPLTVLGHGHSHPDLGGIGVKPSSVDFSDHAKSMKTGSKLWLSQIVDPIRKLCAFYIGSEMQTPNVVCFFYPEDYIVFREGRPWRRKAPQTQPIFVRQQLTENNNVEKNKEKQDPETISSNDSVKEQDSVLYESETETKEDNTVVLRQKVRDALLAFGTVLVQLFRPDLDE